jgi:hypothetical protein
MVDVVPRTGPAVWSLVFEVVRIKDQLPSPACAALLSRATSAPLHPVTTAHLLYGPRASPRACCSLPPPTTRRPLPPATRSYPLLAHPVPCTLRMPCAPQPHYQFAPVPAARAHHPSVCAVSTGWRACFARATGSGLRHTPLLLTLRRLRSVPSLHLQVHPSPLHPPLRTVSLRFQGLCARCSRLAIVCAHVLPLPAQHCTGPDTRASIVPVLRIGVVALSTLVTCVIVCIVRCAPFFCTKHYV